MRIKKINGKIIFFLLFLVTFFSFPIVASAATGSVTNSADTTYLVESTLGFTAPLDYLINESVVHWRSQTGNDDSVPVFYIVGKQGNYNDTDSYINVYISTQPFYCSSYPDDTYVYIDSLDDADRVVIRTRDGGSSVSTIGYYKDDVNSSGIVRLSKANYICSSRDVYVNNTFYLILKSRFSSNPGFSYDSNVDIYDGEQDAADSNQSILDEVLVTEEDEPNVFLRVFKNIGNILYYLFQLVNNIRDKIFEFIDTFFTALPSIIEDAISKVIEHLDSLSDFFNGLINGIRSMLESWVDWVYTHEFLDGVSIQSIYEFFHDSVADIITAIESVSSGDVTLSDLIITALPDKLENIYESIWSMGADYDANGEFNLLTFFKNLLSYLLIPEDGYLENKIDTVVLSKFGFINTGYAFLDSVKSVLNQTSTVMPVITTDTYEWNGITIPSFTISFEWYERFKPYVDPVVSAFCWITFVYHTIVNLPSLLRGGSVAGNAYKDYLVDVEVRNRANSDADKIARNYGWK